MGDTMDKRKTIQIVLLILIVVLVGSSFIMKKRTYSTTDIFENIDFSTTEKTIEVNTITLNNPDIYQNIDVTKAQQQQLIAALSTAKFQKTTSSSEWSHLVILTLNTGYYFYVDTEQKIIAPVDTRKAYKVKKADDFFTILHEFGK